MEGRRRLEKWIVKLIEMSVARTKTYRIGNEIQVRWPIITNGEETSLSNRDLSLYLIDPLNYLTKVKFGTEGNVIVFVYKASEQKHVGFYGLLLYENEGKDHQTATDYKNAFRLVAHSCEIQDGMSSGDIPLGSSNVNVGINGLSAYELAVNYGYGGSEEEWANGFNTVLNSTNILVESIEETNRVLRRTEELFKGLSSISEAEQGRVSSEENREQAEMGRLSAEREREESEEQRSENEEQRRLAFMESEQRRQGEWDDLKQSIVTEINSMISESESRVGNAVAEFSRTELVLTQDEFDALVEAGTLVEGCDYKIIEEDEP